MARNGKYHHFTDAHGEPQRYDLSFADLANGIYCVAGMQHTAEEVIEMVGHIITKHSTGDDPDFSIAAVEVQDIPEDEVEEAIVKGMPPNNKSHLN